jgi:hypothetical protein
VNLNRHTPASFKLEVQRLDFVDHLYRRSDRSQRVVFMDHWDAEHRHDPVAEKLSDRAPCRSSTSRIRR